MKTTKTKANEKKMNGLINVAVKMQHNKMQEITNTNKSETKIKRRVTVKNKIRISDV